MLTCTICRIAVEVGTHFFQLRTQPFPFAHMKVDCLPITRACFSLILLESHHVRKAVCFFFLLRPKCRSWPTFSSCRCSRTFYSASLHAKKNSRGGGELAKTSLKVVIFTRGVRVLRTVATSKRCPRKQGVSQAGPTNHEFPRSAPRDRE